MRPRSPAGGGRIRRRADAGAGIADRDIITVWIWGIGAMAEVELYTTMFCPYCARARALLERKGVVYTDIDILEEPARRGEMIRRAGGRTTVPQIFIDGEHIGGSDELVALDRAGELDAKLGLGK
jgi:glutaredoxin 3